MIGRIVTISVTFEMIQKRTRGNFFTSYISATIEEIAEKGLQINQHHSEGLKPDRFFIPWEKINYIHIPD